MLIRNAALGTVADPEVPNDYKKKFVHILGLASSQTELTDAAVLNLLNSFIEASDYSPSSNINKYNALFNLTKTPHGREELEARHLLKRAVDGRVMYEKQGTYNWNRPEGAIRLGETYTEAIEFVLDPKKQSIIEELERELKLRGVR